MKKILLFALFSALCGAQASAQTVTMALGAEIRNTNPGVDRDDATDGVILHMAEGLVGYRDNGDVAPLLAKDYQISADGKTYTFALRPGVKFHNGEPLTSADVLWSWKRYLDPKTGWGCLSQFDGRTGPKVTDMSAPDPMTFVMQLDRPSATFLSVMAQTDCGGSAIINKASVNPDGSWKVIIGTGPFKFGTWRRGQDITLDRFDDYISPPGDKPDGYVGDKKSEFEHARFIFVPDSSTSKAAVINGQIDVTNIAETDIQEMKNTGKVHIVGKDVRVRRSLIFNTTDPVLKDARVRRALAMILDVDELVAGASNNASKPNGSMIPPSSSFYDAVQKKRIPHDIEQARKLLKEAGYTDQPITILSDNRPVTPLYNIGLFTQQMLSAAGINAKLEVVDFGNLISRWGSGNFQILTLSFSSRMDPSSAFDQIIGPAGIKPFRPWQSQKTQDMLRASLEERDHAKRQKIFDELHELMLQEVPVLALYNGIDNKAVNNRLSAFDSWEFKPLMWTARLAK